MRAVVASGYWAGGPRVRELEAALAAGASAGARPPASAPASARSASRCARSASARRPRARARLRVRRAAERRGGAGRRPVAVDDGVGHVDLGPAARPAGPTAAVLAVHTFGAPADVAALGHGRRVVDDAATGSRPACRTPAPRSPPSTPPSSSGGAEGGAVLSDDAADGGVRAEERDYTDRPMSGHAPERQDERPGGGPHARAAAPPPGPARRPRAARGALRAAARTTRGSSSRPCTPGGSGTATRRVAHRPPPSSRPGSRSTASSPTSP